MKIALTFRTRVFHRLTLQLLQFNGQLQNVQQVKEEKFGYNFQLQLSFILFVDVCSLRLDFESFTTAGPTKTDDSVACIDSFQVTAVSCEISIFIQKFVKWIFRKILQNDPNLCCLSILSHICFYGNFTPFLHKNYVKSHDFFVFPHFFISSNDLKKKNVKWKLRNFTATLFSQFSVKSTFYFGNWFDEKSVNLKLRNLTAMPYCFRKFFVKSTFYLEIDLTKKISIGNYGILLLPHCFSKFSVKSKFYLEIDLTKDMAKLQITEFYCHTVFANFRQINVILWNWFNEKNFAWQWISRFSTLLHGIKDVIKLRPIFQLFVESKWRHFQCHLWWKFRATYLYW